MNEKEIWEKLKRFRSEELKIELLEQLLEKPLEKELKLKIYLALAKAYENKSMLNSAINYWMLAASNAKTFREQQELWLRIAWLWLKQLKLSNAEEALKKALSLANEKEKQELNQLFFNFLIKEAKYLEVKKRYRKALEIYRWALEKYKANKDFLINQLIRVTEKIDPIEANNLKKKFLNNSS